MTAAGLVLPAPLLGPGYVDSKGEGLVPRLERTLQMTTVEARITEDSGAGGSLEEL